MQWSVVCIQNRRCLQPHCDDCLAKDTLFLSNKWRCWRQWTSSYWEIKSRNQHSLMNWGFFKAALVGKNLRDGEVVITVCTWGTIAVDLVFWEQSLYRIPAWKSSEELWKVWEIVLPRFNLILLFIVIFICWCFEMGSERSYSHYFMIDILILAGTGSYWL